MKIAALIFDKITVLDIVGPAEVLSWVPDVEIVWVGKAKGPIRAAPTGLALTIEHTLDEVRDADILIVPGGPGVRLLLKDEPVNPPQTTTRLPVQMAVPPAPGHAALVGEMANQVSATGS